MRVTFAGGVGEHGRNCFLVEGETLSFLVDCGIMAGAQAPYPALTAAQARRLDFVFLTHSHADHTGALAWLSGQGCTATVVATSATLSQVGRLPFPTVCLENNPPPAGLELAWGRAGHCAGSVWYAFGLEGQRLFFSGDYTEHSPVYAVDPVRDRTADLAVLDSAYGPESRSDDAMRQDFLSTVAPFADAGRPVLFPVPKYAAARRCCCCCTPAGRKRLSTAIRTFVSKRGYWPQMSPGFSPKRARHFAWRPLPPWGKTHPGAGSVFSAVRS